MRIAYADNNYDSPYKAFLIKMIIMIMMVVTMTGNRKIMIEERF